MKRFMVYEKGTNRLLREGQCSDASFADQAQNENEVVADANKCIKRTYVEVIQQEKPK